MDSRNQELIEKEDALNALRKKNVQPTHKRHLTEPKAPSGVEFSARNTSISKKLLMKPKQYSGAPTARTRYDDPPQQPPKKQEHARHKSSSVTLQPAQKSKSRQLSGKRSALATGRTSCNVVYVSAGGVGTGGPPPTENRSNSAMGTYAVHGVSGLKAP